MQLTRGRGLHWTMCDAIDHHTAGAANPLAAIVIKGDRLLTVPHEPFVHDVEHLEK